MFFSSLSCERTVVCSTDGKWLQREQTSCNRRASYDRCEEHCYDYDGNKNSMEHSSARHLSKKLSTVTAVTTACSWFPPQDNRSQPTYSHPTSILSSSVRQGLPSGIFPWRSPTEMLYRIQSMFSFFHIPPLFSVSCRPLYLCSVRFALFVSRANYKQMLHISVPYHRTRASWLR
jgi:hypothetical protein